MAVTKGTGAQQTAVKNIALWILKLLTAFAFLAAAYMKLSGNARMVEEFGKIGMGQGFRYLVAIIEGAGALMLLWTRSTMIGVAILICVCAGALFAQLGPLHGSVIHVFVLGGALLLIAWLAKPSAYK